MIPPPVSRHSDTRCFAPREATCYSLLSAVPILAYCLYGANALPLAVTLSVGMLLLAQLLKSGARNLTPLNQSGGVLTALLSLAIYPALPATLMMIALIELPRTTSLLVLLLVAVNDTAAYFGGSLIGGAKLLPRISPGKTWSGFICGVLAASLSALYIGSTGFELFLGSSNLQAFCFGSLFGLLAVIGDLFESLLKRSFGCKDSGTILPGHGGILDRVDAHLFAFPVLLVLFKLI